MKHYLNQLFDELCLWGMVLIIGSTPFIMALAIVKFVYFLADVLP